MWTRAFWQGAAERMIRAAAAVLISLWGTDTFFDLVDIDWRRSLGVAAGAAVMSLLFSLMANVTSAGPTGSASAVYDRPRDYGIPTPVDADRPADR